MPSLAEWYEKLSVALHAADPDEALFKDAQEKIEKHCEIRKAMDISQTPVKKEKPSSTDVDSSKQATTG
jgi:hypothetical protein